MNTQEKGRCAELRVEQEALRKGFIVSRPTTDARYDMIIDDHDKRHRVQVKYADASASHSEGSVLVGFRRWAGDKRHVTRNYDSSEIDAIMVYVPQIDILCWIPPELFDGRPTLTLRIAAPKNGQTVGVHFAQTLQW